MEQYPIFFATGIGFASSKEEQIRWQTFVDERSDRFLRMIEANRTPSRQKTPLVKSFINHNLFRDIWR